MTRRSGLIYKNSKRVELMDPETMEPVDTFVNAADFCRYFGIKPSSGSYYLTEKRGRVKMKGFMCRYEGDTYWEDKAARKQEKKEQKLREQEDARKRKKEDELIKTSIERQSNEEEIKDLNKELSKLKTLLKTKDMMIQELQGHISLFKQSERIKHFDTPHTIDHLKETICGYFNCEESVLESHSRKLEEMWPRHLFAWAIYKRIVPNKLSLEQIGSKLGGKTHATIINSVRKVNNRIETNKPFREDITSIVNGYGFSLEITEGEVELKRI